MVFHRLEIRSKAMNVAKIESKSIRESVKTPKVVSRGAVRPGDICGPFPRWGLRGNEKLFLASQLFSECQL